MSQSSSSSSTSSSDRMWKLLRLLLAAYGLATATVVFEQHRSRSKLRRNTRLYSDKTSQQIGNTKWEIPQVSGPNQRDLALIGEKVIDTAEDIVLHGKRFVMHDVLKIKKAAH